MTSQDVGPWSNTFPNVQFSNMPQLIGKPDWPEGDVRVLVEAPEWHQRESISTFLRSQGFAPVSCPGPEGADGRCSLAAGHGCTAAVEADVVVHAMPHSDPRNREALRSLRRTLPDTPVVVEVPEPTLRQRADDYDGCVAVHPPVSNDELLTAIRQALDL